MIEIIPGILEQEWSKIEAKIELVKPFAKTIHIDLLDGKFAQNTSFFDPKPFQKYTKDFKFELHMMVEEPVQYLKPWAEAGFQRFLGHVERMGDQVEFVAQGQMYGEVGLVLDAQTGVEAIHVPLADIDSLLVMTVKAGFSGQAFLSEALEKVKALREKTALPIQVDGGITTQTIAAARQAGATRFIATSSLFGEPHPMENYHLLLSACGRADQGSVAAESQG